jgi:hypothetical protein
VADVQVSGDGKQPWTQARIGAKVLGGGNQPEPSLFQQLLGDRSVLGHSREEAQQAVVENRENLIPCRAVPGWQTPHQCDFDFPLHNLNNAETPQL